MLAAARKEDGARLDALEAGQAAALKSLARIEAALGVASGGGAWQQQHPDVDWPMATCERNRAVQQDALEVTGFWRAAASRCSSTWSSPPRSTN